MSGATLALLMQFCVMNYQDMYLYTLPNVNTDKGGWHFSEGNVVSGEFQKRGLAGLYVAGTSVGVGLLGEVLGDPWDRVVMAVATGVEIHAIHSWGKFGLGPPEVKWEFVRFEI